MATEFKIENRSIKGEIERSHRADVPQSTPEEFLAAVDAILAVPGVKALGWSQYTPYFNDGDTCEFSLHEVAVKLDKEVFGKVKDEDAYDLKGKNWVTSWSLNTYEKGDYRNPKPEVNGVSTAEIKEALKLWKPAAFENVALENFGDHATVVATTEGFNVEFNEHE